MTDYNSETMIAPMGGQADFTRVLIEAAVEEERGREPTAKYIDRLRRVIRTLSIAIAAALDSRYEHSLQHEGYVRRHIDDRWIYIPFHLAHYFPDDPTLNNVVQAASELALERENPICISGSMTLYKSVNGVADIDLCEYYISDNLSQSAVSASQKVRNTHSALYISLLRYLNEDYYHPIFVEESELQSIFAQRFTDLEEPSIWIEGISFLNSLGLMPISNLILLVLPGASESGAARRSFVFQEAVLTRDAEPPRSLVNAEELGRYLNFLIAEARDFITDNPMKSLKRLLCFFLLTRFLTPIPDLLAVLASSHAQLLAEADRQEMLDRLLEGAPPSMIVKLERLRSPRIPPEQVVYVRAVKVPELRELAQDMLERVHSLYDGLREGDG